MPNESATESGARPPNLDQIIERLRILQKDVETIKDHLWSTPTIREQINAVDTKVERLASNFRILGSVAFVLLALIQIAFAILRVVL